MTNNRGADAVTVLVVEDEALIRMDVADCLEDAGYAVMQASDADEAIRILEAHEEIRLVFTDVDMPGSMDGLRLAAYIRDRWPPIRLIVTSGQIPLDDTDLPSGGRFFNKPYQGSEITDAIAEMLRA